MAEVQMKIRIPAQLHRHIVNAARDNRRSMNAEIVFRCETYEKPREAARQTVHRLADPSHNLIVDELMAQMK